MKRRYRGDGAATVVCLLFVALLAPFAEAEEHSSSQAAFATEFPCCSGFDPRHGRVTPWALIGQSEVSCPDGYAYLFHLPVFSSEQGPAERVRLNGTCCPLPKGALTGEAQFHLRRCPEGSVVTGGRMAADGRRVELRCSTVDFHKFRLGPETRAWSVVQGAKSPLSRFGLEGAPETAWSRIPPTFRYGFGRYGRAAWSGSGCVGYPWGSILTGVGTVGCENFVFRQLFAVRGDLLEPIPLAEGPATLSQPPPE